MASGVAELTEKEKEALRLLLAGHDAKSSASQLDLSVHTINDRLRNARRKLGVSSSREAARILGDTEAQPPQSHAPAPFGMGDRDAPADTADLTNESRAGAFRSTWLAGGMLVMSIAIAAAIIGLTMTGGDASVAPAATGETPAPASVQKQAPAKPASYPRAQAFLAQLDAGDWKGSYDAAGPLLRGEVSLAEWTKHVEPARRPLGAVQDRKLVGVQVLGPRMGNAEREMHVLQFLTAFEGRPSGLIETVFVTRGEGGWEVTLYTVS